MTDYRDILDSIDRGIVTVDLQGKISSCNRALEEILEVEAKTIVGHSLEEAFRREDPLYQLLQESIQEKPLLQDRDLAYTSKKGRIKPLRVTTFPLKKKTGERVGGILLVKDMTEIRNPLSAMDINLQLLQERLGSRSEDPEIGRYLEIISTETRRLNEVLRNAQVFSKPESPDLETVDLHQIIDQVLFLIKEEAFRKKIEISESLRAKHSMVKADPDQMKQVFLNLFKNCIEAMSEGGKFEVLSRNDVQGKIIGVELVDTGSGIPMANLQHVFDPYFTTKKKGTGLGLSIVHNIIAQHGGTIDVTSWLGEGTIFSIILPLASGEKENNRDAKTKNPDRRR